MLSQGWFAPQYSESHWDQFNSRQIGILEEAVGVLYWWLFMKYFVKYSREKYNFLGDSWLPHSTSIDNNPRCLSQKWGYPLQPQVGMAHILMHGGITSCHDLEVHVIIKVGYVVHAG